MGKKIVAFGCMVLALVSLFGCSNTTHKMYEEGYFKYVIVGKASRHPKKKEVGEVAIISLTRLGQTQETIDIPRTIDGKNVRHIGYSIGKGLMGGGPYFYFESDYLKKIYIHDNITSIYDQTLSHGEWDIMVCEARNYSKYEETQGRVFIYKEIYDTLDESTMFWAEEHFAYTWSQRETSPANITFLNGYSNEVNNGYYRLDNVEANEKIPSPPNPVREGYEFTGWYTEPECMDLWDFDNIAEVEETAEFRLYAGWQGV